MKKKVRVRTLYLPQDDAVLSFILSNPKFLVIEKQIVPLVQLGGFAAYVEYEDSSGEVEDPVEVFKESSGYDILEEEDDDYEENKDFIAPEKEKKKGKRNAGKNGRIRKKSD